MEKITVTAKTYDEAITKALISLQTTSDHMVVDIIEKGSAGFFGVIGARPWTIQARVKSEEEEAAEQKAAQEKANNDLEKAIAKKKRLVAAANRDKKAPAKKLSPEELVERRRAALAKAREARKAHKAKLDDLTKAIAESGKSIEEVLAELKKNS